jgi:hypothetical protein
MTDAPFPETPLKRYSLYLHDLGRGVVEVREAEDVKGPWMRADAALAEIDRLREALQTLRINANRLCDRQLGGTYEDDCRRSIAKADDVLR